MLKDHVSTGSVSAALTVLIGVGAILWPKLAAHKEQLDTLVPSLVTVGLGAIGLVDEIIATVKAKREAKKQKGHHHAKPTPKP